MSLGEDLRKVVKRAVPLVEAKELSTANERYRRRLESRRTDVQGRFGSAKDDLDATFRNAFDDFLAPFAQQFARLKNVALDDLPVLESVPELAEVDVRMQHVAVSAVSGLASLAGGSAVGASAGALTFSAVGAFATASTGTAIGSLSGAAATNAILAWLGGGSLAAGGGGVAAGTAVLGGLVAAPILAATGGFLYWQGKKALNQQRSISQKLRQADARLSKDCDRVQGAAKRFRDTERVTRDLVNVGLPKLDAFTTMVTTNQDFQTYSAEDRAKVAELAGLVQTLAAVLASQILDTKGHVTELSTKTLEAARSVVARRAA